MSWTLAQIKDKLNRIEAKIDELLAKESIEKVSPMTDEQVKDAITMTAAERMAHARSFKKNLNTGEGGRG